MADLKPFAVTQWGYRYHFIPGASTHYRWSTTYCGVYAGEIPGLKGFVEDEARRLGEEVICSRCKSAALAAGEAVWEL
jgi:hypothetical protein